MLRPYFHKGAGLSEYSQRATLTKAAYEPNNRPKVLLDFGRLGEVMAQ